MVRCNGSLFSKFDVTKGVKLGGVLSLLLFSVYLNDLLCRPRDHNIGSLMNRHFVAAAIYVDDITLLGPTRNSVMDFLDVCSTQSFLGKKFLSMGTAIKFIPEFTFLGIFIMNNDVTDHNISKTAQKFYHKADQVVNDFKNLYRNIRFQFLSSCCLDAYGSQIWPFYDKSVKSFYVALGWTIRKLLALPNTTHCKYLHSIDNSLPIDLVLEKRCLKCILSYLNSN